MRDIQSLRVYLAARYGRYPEMQGYAQSLKTAGYTITSRWITGAHALLDGDGEACPAMATQWAREDWNDLSTAHICIAFTEPPIETPGRARGGRHVEYGAALAMGKRVIVVGYRENIFHWLPVVEYYATWGEAFEALTHHTEAQS